MSFTPCPDCGCRLPPLDGPTHPYLGASASCWSLYNVILAREYSNPSLMKSVHRLTVDAYAAQHPGKQERRSIQSVWAHLAALYLVLDRASPNDFATRIMGIVSARADTLLWLEPPRHLGVITVRDIAETQNAAEHEVAVRLWANAVWKAWEPHHRAVRTTVDEILSSLDNR